MRNKKLATGCCVIILLVILLIVELTNRQPIGNDVVVGIVLPLTGEAGNYGNQMLNGAILWTELHPKRNIKLVSADGKGGAAASINAFNKLQLSDDIVACISGFSVPTLAMMPVAVERQILLVNAGATNPQIKQGGKYVFSLVPDADVEADYIAQFVSEKLNRKECFIYWQNDDSGKGMLDVFSQAYERYGGRVCGVESFQASEIRNSLAKIEASGADTVFIPTSGDNMAKAVRQAYSMGMTNILWVGYAAAESPSLKSELEGYQGIKVIFSTYAFNNTNEKNDESEMFIDAYRKRFGVTPAYYSATCFDAMDLLSTAVENGCTTSDAISDFIESIGSFKGVSGTFVVHKGDNHVSSGLSFKKFESGQIFELSDVTEFRK